MKRQGRASLNTAGQENPLPAPDGRERLTKLLLRIGQGDRESFTEFYKLTSQRVYGHARRTIVDVEISKDTTQDIYLTVWRDAPKYNPAAGSPMAWLMTITHRRAVDKVRSEQAGSTREARWSAEQQSSDYDVVAETVAARLEAQTVIKCLATLSPIQHEAISLAYYNGLTYREVAEHLSAPLPTVKTRIRNGLKQLRTCLDGA